MKKLLAALLCLMMVFSLTACGGTEDSPEDTAVTKENIKVGFVHISDPSDKGYTYNHDLGTQKMAETLGLSEEQVINKYNISEDASCDTALRELVDAGCNIIFATSFGFENYVLAVAEEYPDVQFCHATGYQAASSGLPNVHNYFVSIYEARYLAGIAAGLKTETNKLGYVAAFPFAEVISGYTAFYLGAKSVNPSVTMDVMYTNSWNDPTTEAQVAQALIDGGLRRNQPALRLHGSRHHGRRQRRMAGRLQFRYDRRRAERISRIRARRLERISYLCRAVRFGRPGNSC